MHMIMNSVALSTVHKALAIGCSFQIKMMPGNRTSKKNFIIHDSKDTWDSEFDNFFKN